MQGLARTSRKFDITDCRRGRGLQQAARACAVAVCCALAISTANAATLSRSTYSAKSGSVATSQTLSLHRAASVSSNSSENDVSLDFVAADINDVLKALAVQTGANIVSSADVKGTITVSLAHVSLEEALDMVARLSGYQYAHVKTVYIVGTPKGIADFSAPEGASTGPEVTAVIPLHYATFEDVCGMLKIRFPSLDISNGKEVDGAKAGSTTVSLVLYGPQDLIDQAKQLVASLEESLSEQVASEITQTYSVKYASIGDCINILNTLAPSLIVTPGPALSFRGTAPSAAASASSSSASGSTSGGESSGSSSGSSGASASGGNGSSNLTGPHMLLLTGTTQDIDKGLDVLSRIDVQPEELLYEAKVTEISDDDEKDLGLTWDFSGASTTIGEIASTSTTGTGSGATTSTAVQYPGQILKFGTFARTPLTNLATVQLNALITNGNAKLLADPNIGAIDGYPAQVFIGDTINYVQSITSSSTGQNITTASIQVGVTLRVTGKCNTDGYITLNIHPEVSSVSQWLQEPGGGQLPDIATRFADTTVRVKDGDTIAIGGLIQKQDLDNVQKVPFFGDLPFIGALFRNDKKSTQRDEVVFFLKTSVMKNL